MLMGIKTGRMACLKLSIQYVASSPKYTSIGSRHASVTCHVCQQKLHEGRLIYMDACVQQKEHIYVQDRQDSRERRGKMKSWHM